MRTMIVVAVCVLAGCALTENRSVVVQAEHLACRVDADCTYEALACSSCGEPVAMKFAQVLRAERDRICRRYRGPLVDCPPQRMPQCRSGRCSVPPEPWQSVD